MQSPSRKTKALRSDSAEMRRVRAALGRLAYQNVARSREALDKLNSILQDAPSPASRKADTQGLKCLILSTDFGSPVPPMPVRLLRHVILEAMKTALQRKLGEYFKAGELEHLDLFGMDFSGAALEGLSFKGCFLVEASFERCHLARASF